MQPFVERLTQRIERPNPDSIGDSIIDAHEIMRFWSYRQGDPERMSGVVGPFSDHSPFPKVSADDANGLKKALLSFIRDNPDHPSLSGAVKAIGYFRAPDTRDVLIEVLHRSLGRNSNVLYQAILALESHGENLYGSRTSTSIDEVERNERVARDFLATLRPMPE